MKYELLSYVGSGPRAHCYHARNTETGETLYLDLHTDASFPDEPDDAESIVGKVVEVEDVFAYAPFYFGSGVRVL